MRMDAYYEELYHHGIKGQKWGDRNGPPYPLSSGNHSASEKKANWTTSLKATSKKKRSVNKSVDVKKKVKKLKNIELTDNQKKALIVAAAAGLTVAGVAIYKRYGQNFVNRTIKAGTTIQSLSTDPKRLEYGRAFYASYKTGDKMAYRGLFGAKNSLLGGETKYANMAVAAKDLKIASNKEGRAVFQDMMKNNKRFNKAVTESFTDSNFHTVFKNGRNPMEVGRKNLSSQKYGKAYDMFNRGTLVVAYDKDAARKVRDAQKAASKAKRKYQQLSDTNIDQRAIKAAKKEAVKALKEYKRMSAEFGGKEAQKARKAADTAQSMYYKELKKRGFSGINDINDQKFFGFYMNSPTIFFDRSGFQKNASGGITKTSEKLSKLDVNANKAGQIGRRALQTSPSAALAAGGATYAALELKDKKKKK